jgi:hypothetical protein
LGTGAPWRRSRCDRRLWSQLGEKRIEQLDVDRQVSQTTTEDEGPDAVHISAAARRVIPRTLEHFHTQPEIVLPEVEGLPQNIGLRLRKYDQAKREVVDTLPLRFS